MLDAACRGSGLFVTVAIETPHTRSERESRAKQVCAECPVRRECLDYSLRVNERLGIWGGLTEIERRDLLSI